MIHLRADAKTTGKLADAQDGALDRAALDVPPKDSE